MNEKQINKNIRPGEDFLFTYQDMEEIMSEIVNRNRLKSIRNRQTGDLPECVRLLYGLEKTLHAQEGLFGDWLQITYELCECEEVPPAELAQILCDTFLQIETQYGNVIARSLYDTQAAVLPEEILNAAEYLKLGGRIEHIRPLCDIGFFMLMEYENLCTEQKQRAVAHLNSGGSVEDVFGIVTAQNTGLTEDTGMHLMREGALLFSRVRLWTDDGEDSEFWVSGDPQEYDDLENTEGLIDFQEFLDGLPDSESKTITAEVTSFYEGEGPLQPVSPEDMERIEKAVDEFDIDAISGWNRLGQHTFSFDYDLNELFGMNGIE